MYRNCNLKVAETVDILLTINIHIIYYITIITIQPLQVLYYPTCMYNEALGSDHTL